MPHVSAAPYQNITPEQLYKNIIEISRYVPEDKRLYCTKLEPKDGSKYDRRFQVLKGNSVGKISISCNIHGQVSHVMCVGFRSDFDSFGAVSIAVHFLKALGLTDDECYKITSNPTNDNTVINDLVPKSLGRNLLYHMQDNHKQMWIMSLDIEEEDNMLTLLTKRVSSNEK